MYRLGMRGLGTLDYYGLLAQANLENCNPRDSACVSNNVAKQAAVEDLWVSKYMVSGAPDDTKLSFTPQSDRQVDEFYSPTDPFNSGNVVDTRGILSVSQGGKSAAYVPPAPPPAPPPAAKPAAGKTVINSSGPADDGGFWAAPGSFFGSRAAGGSVASVPWWAWLAGGGALLLAFKGGR